MDDKELIKKVEELVRGQELLEKQIQDLRETIKQMNEGYNRDRAEDRWY